MPVPPLVEALLGGDRLQASELMTQALDRCGSRISLVSDYVEPALYAISELWYQGAVRANTEEAASELVAAVLSEIQATPAQEPVEAGSRILLAGIDGERHLLGMRVLGAVLGDQGWIVEQLPPEQFGEVVEVAAESRPHVVGLSCGYLPDARQLARTVAALKAQRARVMVGGPAINRAPGLWARVGADATGVDARMAAVAARQQLTRWRRSQQLAERFGRSRLGPGPGRPGPAGRSSAA